MFTVALIGPDGVGKTTIAKRLETSFPIPIKYLYMGVNAESSNYMLPTTRWWEKRKKKRKALGESVQTQSLQQVSINYRSGNNGLCEEFLQDSATKKSQKLLESFGVKKAVIKSVGFINRILEEWYRQFITYSYSKKGYIIIFDRHFIYDYFYYDIQPHNNDTSIKRKIHGFLLRHTLSEPDLVICLDAPGEVVFKRKGEFTLELMELKRTQYLSLKNLINNFIIVDANRDLDLVVKDVNDLIYDYYQNRLGDAQSK